MTKVTLSVRVERCHDCPFIKADRVMGGYYCGEHWQSWWVSGDDIPAWCPLPEAPEEDVDG